MYDGLHLLLELDGQNNVLGEYLHGSSIDEVIALRRNGHTYTYHRDALGSIAALTDETGAIVQRYEYDAYGTLRYTQDPNFKQPFAYTGREWDEESGLYFYRARYYDSGIGAFISKDPIGIAGGINLYAYVDGNPVSNTDPLGLMVIGSLPPPGPNTIIYIPPGQNWSSDPPPSSCSNAYAGWFPKKKPKFDPNLPDVPCTDNPCWCAYLEQTKSCSALGLLGKGLCEQAAKINLETCTSNIPPIQKQ